MKNIIPKFVYHGSVTPDIKMFEPRKRYTPGEFSENEINEAIYAGDDPAYCAAHAFPWGSEEGFNLFYENDKVVLEVPEKYKDSLNQKVYIYKLPSSAFKLLDIEPKGHNFWSKEKVKPIGIQKFNSVTEAIKTLGGKIRII